MFEIEKGTAVSDQAKKQTRRVYFEEFNGYEDCPTFDRLKLKADNVILGPAIIEQMDTTIVIPPNQMAKVDRYGNIVIEITA
jgi:N-methylhydantoinase A